MSISRTSLVPSTIDGKVEILPLTPNRRAMSAMVEKPSSAPILALIVLIERAKASRKDTGPWCERVALLGDAAHAMTPDLGQGACQALEDAVVLTACAAADVPAALADYDRARRERSQELVRASARIAQLANTGNPGAAWLRDLVARALPTTVYLRASADTFGWQPPSRPQLIRQGG